MGRVSIPREVVSQDACFTQAAQDYSTFQPCPTVWCRTTSRHCRYTELHRTLSRIRDALQGGPQDRAFDRLSRGGRPAEHVGIAGDLGPGRAAVSLCHWLASAAVRPLVGGLFLPDACHVPRLHGHCAGIRVGLVVPRHGTRTPGTCGCKSDISMAKPVSWAVRRDASCRLRSCLPASLQCFDMGSYRMFASLGQTTPCAFTAVAVSRIGCLARFRLVEAAFAFRGEDSPQGNPRCRKQLLHLPTLAWRGSPRGGFSQGNPRCRKPFAFADPCLVRILPRANIAIGPSILCSSRICTPYRLAASRLLPTAIVDCL